MAMDSPSIHAIAPADECPASTSPSTPQQQMRLVEHYARRCKGIGADLVLEFISALADPGVTACHLTRRLLQLRDPDVQCMAEVLEMDHTIDILDLDGNRVSSIGAGYLSRTLASNQSLTQLNIANNCIQADGLLVLLSGLASNRMLTSLDVSGNSIELCHVTPAFATLLLHPFPLTELVLNNNQIGDPAFSALCNALLFPRGGRAGLQHLHAAMNEVSDAGAEQLSIALSNPLCLLVSLDVSHNQLGPPGGIALARALGMNRSLRRLNVQGNSLQSSGVAAFARALMQNRHLQELYIGQNSAQDDGASFLIDALLSHPSLLAVCLLDTPLSTNSVQKLLHWMETAPSLLCLFWDPITSVAAFPNIEHFVYTAAMQRARRGWEPVILNKEFDPSIMRMGALQWYTQSTLIHPPILPAPVSPMKAPMDHLAVPSAYWQPQYPGSPGTRPTRPHSFSPSPIRHSDGWSPRAYSAGFVDCNPMPLDEFNPAELELIRQMEKKMELERLHYRRHIRQLEEQLEEHHRSRSLSPGTRGITPDRLPRRPSECSSAVQSPRNAALEMTSAAAGTSMVQAQRHLTIDDPAAGSAITRQTVIEDDATITTITTSTMKKRDNSPARPADPHLPSTPKQAIAAPVPDNNTHHIVVNSRVDPIKMMFNLQQQQWQQPPLQTIIASLPTEFSVATPPKPLPAPNPGTPAAPAPNSVPSPSAKPSPTSAPPSNTTAAINTTLITDGPTPLSVSELSDIAMKSTSNNVTVLSQPPSSSYPPLRINLQGAQRVVIAVPPPSSSDTPGTTPSAPLAPSQPSLTQSAGPPLGPLSVTLGPQGRIVKVPSQTATVSPLAPLQRVQAAATPFSPKPDERHAQTPSQPVIVTASTPTSTSSAGDVLQSGDHVPTSADIHSPNKEQLSDAMQLSSRFSEISNVTSETPADVTGQQPSTVILSANAPHGWSESNVHVVPVPTATTPLTATSSATKLSPSNGSHAHGDYIPPSDATPHIPMPTLAPLTSSPVSASTAGMESSIMSPNSQSRSLPPHPLEELAEPKAAATPVPASGTAGTSAAPPKPAPPKGIVDVHRFISQLPPSTIPSKFQSMAQSNPGNEDMYTAVMLRQRYPVHTTTGELPGSEVGTKGRISQPHYSPSPLLSSLSSTTSPSPAPSSITQGITAQPPTSHVMEWRSSSRPLIVEDFRTTTTTRPLSDPKYETVEVQFHSTTSVFRPMRRSSATSSNESPSPNEIPGIPDRATPAPAHALADLSPVFPIPPPRLSHHRTHFASPANIPLATDNADHLPVRKQAPCVTPIASQRNTIFTASLPDNGGATRIVYPL